MAPIQEKANIETTKIEMQITRVLPSLNLDFGTETNSKQHRTIWNLFKETTSPAQVQILQAWPCPLHSSSSCLAPALRDPRCCSTKYAVLTYASALSCCARSARVWSSPLVTWKALVLAGVRASGESVLWLLCCIPWSFTIKHVPLT